MIENIIENIIIYLTLSIISFYAAYKYQKNSEYALKFLVENHWYLIFFFWHVVFLFIQLY